MVHKKLNSNDHYVSETYLRHFSHEKEKYKAPHVFMYRKKEHINKPVPIKSICHRPGGDIINNFSNKFGLRKLLSIIEPAWNIFIDAIAKRKVLEFNQIYSQGEEIPFLYKVSLYLAYLRGLSPTSERLMKEYQEHIFNHIMLPRLTDFPHNEIEEKTRTASRKGEIKVLINDSEYYKSIGVKLLPEVAKNFYNKEWKILINISNTQFVTSDTPIIPIGEPEKLDTQAPIYLPLTPKYALLILPTENSSISYEEIDHQEVKKYNDETAKWATEMIISSINDEEFSKLVDQYRGYEAKNKIVTINYPNSIDIFSCHTTGLKKTS